ncbi:sigma factor-like helix-turn-helix DNA-binding protein [Streptomyces sp. NPDC001156]
MKQSPSVPLPHPKECRRLRRTQSLTQAQMAANLHVPIETVRDWETGLTSPRGRKRKAYARLLAEWAVQEGAQESADERLPIPLTPHQAFDELYRFCTPALVRQAYLLTGRRGLARESVERAFQQAWQRWPEVAMDRYPPGWVRAASHDWALSPWHHFRPRHRRAEEPPADPANRELLQAFLTLPPVQRRTLLLHDGVGLGLPETAAETQASTPATAARLLRARTSLAALVPDQASPDVLGRRLTELATAERLRAARPPAVRSGGERRVRRWSAAAVVLTAAFTGSTALTMQMAADHYERPVPRGTAIEDIPALAAQGPLSARQQALWYVLKAQADQGPERLIPEAR